MSEELTYQDLVLPFYRNDSIAISVSAKKGDEQKKVQLTTAETMTIPVLACLNELLVSDTGGGKSQFLWDVKQHFFNGNVSTGGRVNELVGRKDSSVDELFTEWDKEKQKYVVKEERIRALVNIVDELNRAPAPVQNDYFDLAEGIRAINGTLRELGEDGYCLFLAAVNLNRINGDFEGTNNIDRALLSRSKINTDLDYYDTTDKNKAKINAQGKPELKKAPPRDISDKILMAFKEIREKASKPNPHLEAYLMLFSAGLKTCQTDELKRKRRNWPQDCGTCAHKEKTLCSLVKTYEPRTAQTIKRFACGIDYFVKLKEGAGIELDPLDLAFEAAKFTAYHGNLNMQELVSTYKGDDQHMMNTVLAKIKEAVQKVRPYLGAAILEAEKGNVSTETKYISYTIDGTEKTVVYDEKLAEMLKDKKIKHKTIDDPFSELEKIGIGTSWIKSYLETVAKK